MMDEKNSLIMGIGSSSLYEINLSCGPYGKGVQTSSHLVACVEVESEVISSPCLGNKMERDVRISARIGQARVCIDVALEYNVCLESELIDIITSILLLYDEEFEYAIASEEGMLLDIREIVQQ